MGGQEKLFLRQMKKSLDDSGKMKDGSASGKMIVVMWLADSGVLNKKNEDNLSDCKKSDLTIFFPFSASRISLKKKILIQQYAKRTE